MTLPKYIPNYENFEPGKTPVLYSGPYWDRAEIDAAKDALEKGLWLTSGEYVARFENEFSRKFNVRYSRMTNSGSSANLVMIAALKKRYGWHDGDEVIVSPVGFPTTIAPIVQNGLKPVFVDIEMRSLNFDMGCIAAAITKRTQAVFVSPVLGNPPAICDWPLRHFPDIKIVGDNCDSLGSRLNGRLWTDYCCAWSTSFYPAHHISTGEGGMVSSNDKYLMDSVQSFCQWGRDCYCVGAANTLPCGTCGKRFSNWLGDNTEIDHKYLFTHIGYNLKPLDLQGAIGLAQLKKFDEIENRRKRNFRGIAAAFDGHSGVRVASVLAQANPSWFGVPLICDTEEIKKSLVAHLEAAKIQTRPYFAGNLLRHPGYSHLGNAAKYPNAEQALKRVLFIGCAPHYTQAVIDYIGEVVKQCV